MFSLFMKSGRICKKKNQRQSFGCCLSQVTKGILNKLRSTFCAFWRCRFKNMKGKSVKKGRDWILEKKERRRRQGRYVYDCDSLAKLLISFKDSLYSVIFADTFSHSLLCVCGSAGTSELTQNTPDVRENLVFSCFFACSPQELQSVWTEINLRLLISHEWGARVKCLNGLCISICLCVGFSKITVRISILRTRWLKGIWLFSGEQNHIMDDVKSKEINVFIIDQILHWHLIN